MGLGVAFTPEKHGWKGRLRSPLGVESSCVARYLEMQKSPLTGSGPFLIRTELLNVAGALFAVALASESFLRPALFAGLQIEGMALNLFYDIFLLDLPLKAAQRAL